MNLILTREAVVSPERQQVNRSKAAAVLLVGNIANDEILIHRKLHSLFDYESPLVVPLAISKDVSPHSLVATVIVEVRKKEIGSVGGRKRKREKRRWRRKMKARE